MDYVTLDEFKKEKKRRERNEKIRKALNGAINFVDEHKEGLSVATALILGGSKIAKNISSNRKANKRIKEERRHRDLEIYDHSKGNYLQLKRPMKTAEVLEYTSRCEKGEAKAFILHDMGLLK